MARIGACKDRLGEAFDRFGRVPVEKRTRRVSPGHPSLRSRSEAPTWAAGGLVHDGQGRVLLLQHTRDKGWGDAWVTPGGKLAEGETTLQGFEREVREEAGIGIMEPALTRILQEKITDGRTIRHAYFAQFVARADSLVPRPGPDVREARWFNALPQDLAYREDYEEDFRRLVAKD